MNTRPEPICIDLADGSTFEAMIHVENGKLHVALPFLGSVVIHGESATAVCSRILRLLDNGKCSSTYASPDGLQHCELNDGHLHHHRSGSWGWI